jgi:malate-CoA ligase subunit beta
MNIHECQAKELLACLLAGFGVPIPKGGVAYCADNAAYVAAQLGGDHWAVKAQIHAGGRCAAESGDISSAREGDEASP